MSSLLILYTRNITNTSHNKVSYHKHIMHQHLRSTMWKFSSHLVWSPRKTWLLFLILRAMHVGNPKTSGDILVPPLWTSSSWRPRNTLLCHGL